MSVNLEEIKSLHLDFLPSCQFDHLAFAYIDFKSNEVNSWVIKDGKELKPSQPIYFDLASLTKPLSLGTYYLKNKDKFTPEQILLLEHRAGLPAYGSLSSNNWKEQILSYPIQESPTLYSDYSSLRLMLEIGEIELQDAIFPYFDEVKFWRQLTKKEASLCPQTGFRLGRPIQGVVHDPNAYTINRFCSHSGLFGTVEGLSRTLLKLDHQFGLLGLNVGRNKSVNKNPFILGWEGINNQETTLAGKNAGLNTFGFLGFTGTSTWIDPERQAGWVLLANATQKYWYEKDRLNELRRRTGELVWHEK